MEVEEVLEEPQSEPINNETLPTTVQEPESAQMEVPTVAPESPQSVRAFDNGEEGPVELPESSSSTAQSAYL
jgi:hypothetical protein